MSTPAKRARLNDPVTEKALQFVFEWIVAKPPQWYPGLLETELFYDDSRSLIRTCRALMTESNFDRADDHAFEWCEIQDNALQHRRMMDTVNSNDGDLGGSPRFGDGDFSEDLCPLGDTGGSQSD